MAVIKTFSGRMFPLLDPTPDDVDIEDIAHGLARTCRFAGHVLNFYCVAQHCVHVSQKVPPGMELQGLLHDAAEAYVGDMTQPLKMALIDRGEHGYRLIENRIMEAIAAKFGINAKKPAEVADADLRMFATEARDLMSGGLGGYKIPDTLKPYDDMRIISWSPISAKAEFLRVFKELIIRRDKANQIESSKIDKV